MPWERPETQKALRDEMSCLIGRAKRPFLDIFREVMGMPYVVIPPRGD